VAQPKNRQEFIEWCLRRLGKPVIEINVDIDQVEDRIDEAISLFNDYHFDGTERIFFKHQVTSEDKANRYITIPENIIGVSSIFDISFTLTSSGMFSPKYQFLQHNLHDLSNGNMSHFVMSMQHLQYMEELLSGKQPIRYNRHVNKLHIDMDWNSMEVGSYIVVECYSVVDPKVYPDIWKDRWLQNYATALIKYQWGSNLTKFENMQLPGGVVFNGLQILTDAREELITLRDELVNSYSIPAFDLIG